ncbi:hypothetical protein MMON44395_15945 [Mycolicibacterium monacense DSM 44395]|nr:hypothetical protein [Mycolicibacterium monacense DSM 44395]
MPATIRSSHGCRRRTTSRGARRRTLPPMAGQAFEIVMTRDATGWSVTVPELSAVTHRADRAEAEMAARELISRHTGIPHGFVAIWSRD